MEFGAGYLNSFLCPSLGPSGHLFAPVEGYLPHNKKAVLILCCALGIVNPIQA